MCHENEEWNNIWKRIVVSVQNWYEEFDEFWPKHSKSSKICLLMGWFWPKYIMLELKKYRGVWETFLYENNHNYNSYKFSYKFTFIPFLFLHRSQKQESNFQQVRGLVTRSKYLFCL